MRCSSGAGKKYKQKKNSSRRKKPTPHTTSTYEDFRDWKGDGNYVHYDRRSASSADHWDYVRAGSSRGMMAQLLSGEEYI
jgi:hypothetical protein